MGPSVKPSPAPPPPTIDDAKLAAERQDQVLQRKGRAATMVSTPQGQAAGGSAVKVLMGQGG